MDGDSFTLSHKGIHYDVLESVMQPGNSHLAASDEVRVGAEKSTPSVYTLGGCVFVPRAMSRLEKKIVMTNQQEQTQQ